ncbi:hypothetical protein TELCIR_19898 [Teladorsagia circumcincta]|uniref:Hemimethylated DNA-binding domain-containing protein n=1 Tax=Teladorsagia circumcincta TaxID=45464 RepID=A0A2G9TMG4_TELCI|nr:hypothetical protein TELCIR_19898 [Teladorsagia circumcincta]
MLVVAGSLRVRERAPHVQWRVGQVIRHKVHGYRAVIIGWDLKAQASKDFIERVHKGNEALGHEKVATADKAL